MIDPCLAFSGISPPISIVAKPLCIPVVNKYSPSSHIHTSICQSDVGFSLTKKPAKMAATIDMIILHSKVFFITGKGYDSLSPAYANTRTSR